LHSGRFFAMSPKYWLKRRTRYDLEVTEDLLEDRLDQEVHTLKAQSARVRARDRCHRPKKQKKGAEPGTPPERKKPAPTRQVSLSLESYKGKYVRRKN